MMKNKMLGVAIATVLTMAIFVSPVRAGDYLGEFCFEATSSTDGTIYVMKLGITDMGGNHFQVAGTWESTPKNGNAEMIDNNIEFTLTYAYRDPSFVYSRVAHMELDSSLNGYIRAVKIQVDSSGASAVSRYVMPVRYVPCE
jgi:hypothetical protein